MIFAPVAAFWALFFQYASSWVLQAEKLDRRFLGHEWLASQVPSVEPVFILLLIPVFAGGLYPWLRRRGLEPTPLRRMQAGMFVTGLSFACVTAIQAALDGGARPGVAWQLPAYLLLAVGEILVSITVLAVNLSRRGRAAAQSMGLEISDLRLRHLGIRVARLKLPRGSRATEIVDRLRRTDPDGTYDLDGVYRLAGQATPCTGTRCYGEALVGLPTQGCPLRARIGMVDSAIDAKHPALAGRRLGMRRRNPAHGFDSFCAYAFDWP